MAVKPPKDPIPNSKLVTQEIDWEVYYDFKILLDPTSREHNIEYGPVRDKRKRKVIISKYLLAGWTLAWFTDDPETKNSTFHLLRLPDDLHNRIMEIVCGATRYANDDCLCDLTANYPLDKPLAKSDERAVISHLEARIKAMKIYYANDGKPRIVIRR